MPTLKYHIDKNGNKLCPDCSTLKPAADFRKARNHLTTRCIPCLRAYSQRYRQRPEVKVAMLNYSREYRRDETHRAKLNANTRASRMKPKAKLQRNATRKAWTARERAKAIEYKGGKCVCCGYNACAAALDFHHRNPQEKEGYGSGAIVPHWNFEKNKRELDKCELVCVRCHREIHAGFRTL